MKIKRIQHDIGLSFEKSYSQKYTVSGILAIYENKRKHAH